MRFVHNEVISGDWCCFCWVLKGCSYFKAKIHHVPSFVLSCIGSWVNSSPVPQDLLIIEPLELWGWGPQGRKSLTPPFSTISHSLMDPKVPQKCLFPPLLGSSLGWCSQAVVGKSRTTGSIYLTSVSSTIAKHHQRAAAPPGTRVSKRSSEESLFYK